MRQRPSGILHALRRNSSVLERFWASVSRSDAAGGCWEWQGFLGPGNYPKFRVGQYAIPASHLAWFTGTGELPAGGQVRQLCANPLCVRPSHLAWAIGRTTQRVLETLSDGYVPLTGVPFVPADRDPRAPRVFRLMASSQDVAATEGVEVPPGRVSLDPIAAA